MAETWVRGDQLELDLESADAQVLGEVLVSSIEPMPSICAPVRPSMPSGTMGSMLASETIRLSSVIAKRRNCSSSSPGWAIRPMRSISAGDALGHIGRAAAPRRELEGHHRGVGVGVELLLGFLMSLPPSAESSSITKKRLIW